jgi:hypothetical protein
MPHLGLVLSPSGQRVSLLEYQREQDSEWIAQQAEQQAQITPDDMPGYQMVTWWVGGRGWMAFPVTITEETK